MNPSPLSAAVLAGGRSERLGRRPKALLPLGASSEPLIAATVALLSTIADPVLVGTGTPGPTPGERFGFLGKQLVPDEVPGQGPLSGILAVLEASPHELCLVVACDMPFLSAKLLQHLARLAAQNPGVEAVVPRTARGLHPLHAVYRRSLIPTLRAQLALGELSVQAALRRSSTLEVLEPELLCYDPGGRSLENVNTPEDLARVMGADAANAALRAVRADP